MFCDIGTKTNLFTDMHNSKFIYTFALKIINLIMAGIYLHIPFCKKRCIYCDFFSTTQSEKKDNYVQALCNELKLRKDYLETECIETVYLGGGTPSQLAPKDFELIFQTLTDNFQISEKAEITLEANPDDLTTTYIADLRNFPFNRLSMGIQTFNEYTLKLLNRRHTAIQAIQAYDNCRKAGFQNISIDLIYGLPGEDKAVWQKDLEQATSMQPEHISAYHLIYEENTPLWNLREQHKVHEADEDLSLSLFSLLIEHLSNHGYQHYEISNYCLPGKHSRHNSSYWKEEKYLGCGPSAHSYYGTAREWNISSLDDYIAGIQNGNRLFEAEALDLYTRYNDYVITSLRTCWGMNLEHLKQKYGEKLYHYCMKLAHPYLEQDKLKIEKDHLILTREGIFLSDGIMSDLLWVE